MSIGFLSARLLGNMLAGKSEIPAVEATIRSDESFRCCLII